MSEAKATRISTVANLCNNMLGASLLSLPWCLSKTGIILGLALHIISALLNGFAMMIIAISCDKTKSFTFRDLGKKTIGPTFGIILEVFILLYTTLTCVSMLVLTGDFISGSNGAALSLCEDDNGTICQLLRNRMLLVFVTTLLIVGPLSCLQSLHSLRYISIFSFLGVIYLAAFIPYDFSQAEIGPNIKYAIWGLGIFQAIPVFNETFVAQYNVPRYYYEMRNRSVKAFGRAVMTAMSICIIFYVLVAVFGYLAFGSDVNPDILSNYNRDYKAANVAKILMAFVVLSTYPLAFNSLRVSAAELFKTYSSFKLDDASHYYGLTLILVLMTMIPGAFITDISTVTDYKGSILGAFVAFIFGALIYLHTFFPELFNTAFMRHFRSAHEELAEEQRARLLIEHEVYSDNEYRRNNWKGFAYILILWAMMTFIMGTITTTQNAIKKSK